MSSDPQRVQAVFLAAVEKPAADRRVTSGSRVQRRSGVARSRRGPSKAHDEPGSFLDSPPSRHRRHRDSAPSAEQPGTVIGPYKLLEQIGEGGFGVVFLAEQERPVRRTVALKIIKPGMDTRQVIARFEAERQALAMMDHPNIAKVLRRGSHGERPALLRDGAGPGRPDHRVLRPVQPHDPRAAGTVRHGLPGGAARPSKGVIHRDIKPTNVLVAMQDGRPAPKIIDFGVAKAIGQRLTEHTLTTAFAQMVGTPLYMSPEQAELSPLGVDTRSDIYSLGVLLYELLTGTTPFDKDRLHAASYDELRRIIREEEPPRPSARISTLAADLATTVAEHRRTDAAPAQPDSPRRARLDRDEVPGKGPQPPLRNSPTAWPATSSATCTTSRCRPARRRRATASASSLAATK